MSSSALLGNIVAALVRICWDEKYPIRTILFISKGKIGQEIVID